MQPEIDVFQLKVKDQVYYLGDMSLVIGNKFNPTAGWGTITDIVPKTQFAPVKFVIDMGAAYPSESRKKTVPYYVFKPGPLQQFKTEQQLQEERTLKNEALNCFYKGINRSQLQLA